MSENLLWWYQDYGIRLQSNQDVVLQFDTVLKGI